jgi:dienelactone hydrolase
MTITRSTTIADQNHLVTYTDNIGVQRTIARTIEFRVFAPDTPGDYPVILYSHGLGGSPFAGAGNVASDLAALGYIVIAPTHLDSFRTAAAVQDDFYTISATTALHRVADIQFLLSNAAALAAGLPGYSVNLTDPTIAGHSMGAFTTALLTGVTSNLPEIANLAAGNSYGLNTVADARFKQAILLSPQGISSTFGFTADSWDKQTIPALSITGTLDVGIDLQSYQYRLSGFDSGPATGKHAVVIEGADHGQVGGDATNPAFNSEVTAAASLFLQAYVGNSTTALATLNDPTVYHDGHPLVREMYVRSGIESDGFVQAPATPTVISGLSTDDYIIGGASGDVLEGGFGDDTIIGGTGNDLITGGSGLDVYRYSGTGNQGNDVITDFNALLDIPNGQYFHSCSPRYRSAEAAANAQQDHIDLRGTGYAATDLGSGITAIANGSSTLIRFNAGALTGTTITLQGVAASSINAVDFFF